MTGKKVMVGMSGGVDSSVAAAILLQKGYNVIGVTMQIWPDRSEKHPETEGGCCSLSAVDDAMRVSHKLGIPYYVMNFKDIFELKVINNFKEEYLKGRTPNPCIACNRFIKFHAMLKKAMSMQIDYVATGHYAMIQYNENIKRFLLKKSVDEKKDQTYVLYNLTQEQLGRILMPIGEFTKEQVREKAEEIGLAVAAKPDSQEICFIEDNNYGRFIVDSIGHELIPGDFIDTKGNVLGRHKGMAYYTVGQRKGLGIALGKPMFVVRIDAKNNMIILGDETEVYSDTLTAGDLNFISIKSLETPLKVKAKIRYTAREADATIFPETNEKVKVVFDMPQRAVTPGQSVVFYDNGFVVGGGVIETADN